MPEPDLSETPPSADLGRGATLVLDYLGHVPATPAILLRPDGTIDRQQEASGLVRFVLDTVVLAPLGVAVPVAPGIDGPLRPVDFDSTGE